MAPEPAVNFSVNGDGYISDESSFYGEEDEKARLEELVASYDPLEYFSTQQPSFTAIALRKLPFTPLIAAPKAYNPYEGQTNARQLSESLASFLARLPPETTPAEPKDPWIWMAFPYSTVRATDADLASFTKAGTAILDRLTRTKSLVEKAVAREGKDGASKAYKTTFARKYKPRRLEAEAALLEAAKQHGVTTGKWLLFPLAEDVNHVWELVVEATLKGQLGYAAKVAPDDGQGGASRNSSDSQTARVVCVYTRDFGDKKDVKRVLDGLVERGLVPKKGPTGQRWGIHYKCDALTHLGLNRGNEWEITPSLYSSVEMLDT